MLFPKFRRAAGIAAAALLPATVFGQTAAPPARLAALNVALYTAGANQQEASDSAMSSLATGVLRGHLAELLGPALVDSAATAEQAVSPAALALTGNKPCNVIVACAKLVGGQVGASWVVMAKVSKTSNLIWLLTGQLINVRTGEILMDDSTELKGDPEAMIKAGVRIFAERVAKNAS